MSSLLVLSSITWSSALRLSQSRSSSQEMRQNSSSDSQPCLAASADDNYCNGWHNGLADSEDCKRRTWLTFQSDGSVSLQNTFDFDTYDCDYRRDWEYKEYQFTGSWTKTMQGRYVVSLTSFRQKKKEFDRNIGYCGYRMVWGSPVVFDNTPANIEVAVDSMQVGLSTLPSQPSSHCIAAGSPHCYFYLHTLSLRTAVGRCGF